MLLPEECASREELLENMKIHILSNMPLRRPIHTEDIEYAVEETVKWFEEYLQKEKREKT